jgi:hypothetical protein
MERNHVTRVLLAVLVAVVVAAAGCDKGEAGRPASSPAVPEKGAAAQPGGTSPEKAPAPAPKADPPRAATPVVGAVAVTVIAVGTNSPPAKREVDNSRCHVCHLDFSDEQLAVSHAKNGVGCEKCHGPSDDHASDEANITPPSIMYAREKIDTSCKVCHPDPMERIVAGARYCLYVLLTEEEQKKVCADCHGAHRMAQRSVRWDKVTGKVLPKANGQG